MIKQIKKKGDVELSTNSSDKDFAPLIRDLKSVVSQLRKETYPKEQIDDEK